jgi:hypothetical protein
MAIVPLAAGRRAPGDDSRRLAVTRFLRVICLVVLVIEQVGENRRVEARLVELERETIATVVGLF